MPKLTINGKEVQVPEGTNLIEAAKAAGADVPHYCYHPALSIAGQCRLCMVDIDKVPRPQNACNTQAAEGMVVHTETERVKETRRSMMEFHLINHPLDCPVCDHRGDHSEIGLFPGKTLENRYSGNVIDICPVGALTDRDFRFQVRVWYLDTAKGACRGGARGCNIEAHTNKPRPHHNQGRRVARLKPRFNADVN